MTNNKEDIYFNLTLIIIFASINVVGILHHEIWLDEAHHWLLARDSKSIADLFHNARYEGHPLLWNMILFVFTRFSTNVMGMQVINVIISVAALTLFVFYSPFNKLEKSLFSLGNFMIYEYSVISRNYALLLFFLFFSIMLYKKNKNIALGCTLALLANTHLFGLIIAGAFVVMCFYEIWIIKAKSHKKEVIIGFAIFFIGALTSVIQIFPPLDSPWYQSIHKSNEIERLARTSTVFLKGFVPVSDFTNYNWWNTNLLMNISKPFCALLSVILFFYPFIFFKKNKPALLFFYFSTSLMLLFFYASDLNAPRYYGIIYMVFISVVWLSSSTQLAIPQRFLNHRKLFFASILIIQMLAGLTNYTIDLTRPFSESKNVAAFLNSGNIKGEYIAGGCGAAPIAAYLEKKIYYLTNQEYGSFCHFNRKAQEIANNEIVQKEAALNFVAKSPLSVYYITHSLLHISSEEAHNFQLIGSFDKSALRKENYYVYKVFVTKTL